MLQTKTEKNILFVSEGQSFEPKVVHHLFDVYFHEKGNIVQVVDNIPVYIRFAQRIDYPKSNFHIFIMKPAGNRLKELMALIFSSPDRTIETLFSLGGNQEPDNYIMRFFCFDVDYASYETLEKMTHRLNDPYNEGLLLLSSPCIEALGDLSLSEYRLPSGKHLSHTYKRAVRDCLLSLDLHSNGNKKLETIVSENLFTCLSLNERKAKQYWNNEDRYDDLERFLSHFSSLHNSKEEGYIYPVRLSLFYLCLYTLLLDEGLDDQQIEERLHEFACFEPLYEKMKVVLKTKGILI